MRARFLFTDRRALDPRTDRMPTVLFSINFLKWNRFGVSLFDVKESGDQAARARMREPDIAVFDMLL